MAAQYTYEITVGDETEEIEIPESAVDTLANDETPAQLGADLVVLGLLQQVHGAVHHAEGMAEDDLISAEADLKNTFEERFGIPFEQMIGHDH